GIRDPLVTAVQTCALPICHEAVSGRAEMPTAVSVQLRDVRVPGDGEVEIDQGELQVLDNRQDLPAGPFILTAVLFFVIPGLGGEVDGPAGGAPTERLRSSHRPRRPVSDLSCELCRVITTSGAPQCT